MDEPLAVLSLTSDRVCVLMRDLPGRATGLQTIDFPAFDWHPNKTGRRTLGDVLERIHWHYSPPSERLVTLGIKRGLRRGDAVDFQGKRYYVQPIGFSNDARGEFPVVGKCLVTFKGEA